MRVTPPLKITDAILTSSTAAEPGVNEAAYDPGTSYAKDVTCSVIVSGDWTSRHVYKSLQAANMGNTPASSPTFWIDQGPTNRWKMFDLNSNSQTVSASPLTFVLTPGVRVNSLILSGMVADSVVVTATTGGVQVYSFALNLSTRDVHDYYTYCFEPFSTAPNLALYDLPPYTNLVITVTLTRTSGNVSCGPTIVGSAEYIGDAEYQAKSDVINFSSITRDDFGGLATLTPRRNVPKTAQTLWIDKSLVKRVAAVRNDLNAAIAAWSCLDDSTDGYFDVLFLIGFPRVFTIDVDYPGKALINLELEGF